MHLTIINCKKFKTYLHITAVQIDTLTVSKNEMHENSKEVSDHDQSNISIDIFEDVSDAGVLADHSSDCGHIFLKDELATWGIKSSIPQFQPANLLRILCQHHSYLPKDPRILCSTS